MQNDSLLATVLSAGIAGTASDLALHPLDTIKTRIQSTGGFWKAGGFKSLYKGLSVVLLGSGPESALFFVTYETSKHHIQENFPDADHTAINMGAACVAEVISCLVRVPTEVMKQRMQMGMGSLGYVAGDIYSRKGLRGMYTGYGVTIMREIPYALIQFPMYEYLMNQAHKRSHKRPESLEAAFYGSVSGALAAAITTPLDVVKTRLMLAEDTAKGNSEGIVQVSMRIVHEEGPRALFKGISARVTWIGLGGFVLFGAYEHSKKLISKILSGMSEDS